MAIGCAAPASRWSIAASKARSTRSCRSAARSRWDAKPCRSPHRECGRRSNSAVGRAARSRPGLAKQARLRHELTMGLRRVAAIYDIHANLPALDAVLAAVRAPRVDHLVVGGGGGPRPAPPGTEPPPPPPPPPRSLLPGP